MLSLLFTLKSEENDLRRMSMSNGIVDFCDKCGSKTWKKRTTVYRNGKNKIEL